MESSLAPSSFDVSPRGTTNTEYPVNSPLNLVGGIYTQKKVLSNTAVEVLYVKCQEKYTCGNARGIHTKELAGIDVDMISLGKAGGARAKS